MEALLGIFIGLALILGAFELLKFTVRHLVGIIFTLFVLFLFFATLVAGA